MNAFSLSISSLYTFAAGYGADPYNTSTYQGSATATATGTTTSGGTTALQNTGVNIILPLLVSVCLIAAAAVLFVKRKA